MPRPKLTFFCELPPEPLAKLFDGRFVIDDLKGLDAALSLGVLDFSDQRAQLVKRLNKAGVPVIAWLLLPEEEGYWFNIDNYTKATARYKNFKDWTAENGLHWAGVGLDIETDINDLRTILLGKADKSLSKKLLKKFYDKQRIYHAKRSYQSLVELIHADGYTVETYHLPLIIDERRARSTVLQRVLGLVDLGSDCEVLMLYSSFLDANGDAMLWSYAAEADSIGVGITGGGVELPGNFSLKPLTWDQFSRDLRLCVIKNKPIHVFSLEGCVEQNFLSKLNTFDWDQPTPTPKKAKQVRFLRTLFTTMLWLIERPWVVLVGIASLVGLSFLFNRLEKFDASSNQ